MHASEHRLSYASVWLNYWNLNGHCHTYILLVEMSSNMERHAFPALQEVIFPWEAYGEVLLFDNHSSPLIAGTTFKFHLRDDGDSCVRFYALETDWK